MWALAIAVNWLRFRFRREYSFSQEKLISTFDREWYLEQNPDVATAGIDPLAHYLRFGAFEGRDPHPLFDSDWYLEQYPDVAAAGIGPFAHYLRFGAFEGRDPHPLFDSDWYLEQYSDVAAAGIDPLTHYHRFGAFEGRDPNPLFDSDWYLAQNPDVAAGINPLAHYLRRGAAEGRDPNPLFDSRWYLEQNPDVAAAGIDPLVHYVRWGAAEGRDPNPLFDGDWYLKQNPEIADPGINPLAHYLLRGATETRCPSPFFDADWYLKHNPDVMAAGINPLAHYLRSGTREGRSYRAAAPKSSGSSPTVSVIIPCYNGARWLGQALQSVQDQTLRVHEIIVVDDASVDDSSDIARQYGALIIRNPRNHGEGYSRNVGLRQASGELIAWIDADDLWMPHHVSTLTELLVRYPRATTGFAAVQRFGLRNELIRGYVPLGEPTNVFWFAFRDWLHTTIGSLTRRAALLEIGGFNERERYSVDFDLWLRLSRSHLFVCTHEVTSYWRWHDAQQSSQREKQIAALYRFRRSYWERERTVGNAMMAAEIEQRMAEIWHQDMAAAWGENDLCHLRFLYGLAALVPGIPEHCRADWEQRVAAG